ncbi:formyltetrahydrofolate deformylase, variant [Spizellomyces punctatus DAOM BR117]|uniref:Formyltetrahydrofolate deformylase, variant n=1 Tax=Spizellomyces punctatus (strain DAOM BR117) TaxID=645134 RepID=A0A0L0H3I0_SPIPD|nr:formyltetrahydrofolate deformylase, variant [Spizellomyces punctatus DAOM BR117]KNC96025.1 formyltetrahydrofolate deformylase, variant [Spizellomyces punctatus DAOM BR117]|eukprot:XP_016604065.1 formyltetrahydrofolate deformylase, variant [Spizellomyces punctatus DAOM BR117]
MTTANAILLIVCPDVAGIVASLSSFVLQHDGNLVDVDFHTDREQKLFLGRLEWSLASFALNRQDLQSALATLCDPYNGRWQLHFSDTPQRIALFVSKQDHCLLDLLHRTTFKDIPNAEIVVVISNHHGLQAKVQAHGIPFHVLTITKENKAQIEADQLALLKEYNVDLLVLAKYMQILSPTFLSTFPNTINIHHSFLPAFVGAKPYHQAHARGVKIIGATAHFATVELDAGPIIEQEVVRVSHRDSVDDLVRKGKDVERTVLGRAVRLHLLRRVLTYGNKTVVFA